MNLDAFDAGVLRAMLRLARRRQTADDGEVAIRVGGASHSVRSAVRRLAEAGLVERLDGGASRLTMTGFALAVALLPTAAGASASARRTPRAA
jgi:Mn-dependent DtxR family transcriptional regulator